MAQLKPAYTLLYLTAMTNDLINAQVITSYGAHGVVRTDEGVLLECRYRRKIGRPLCGDRLLIKANYAAAEASLEKILPRTSSFYRGDARLNKHAVAANLEQIIIVVSPWPEPPIHLIDRYLVAVEYLQLEALLVLNKADLFSQYQAASEQLQTSIKYLESIGYPALEAYCKNPGGTGQLEQALTNKCSILVGLSGVGKSSLINSILPDKDIQTRAVSAATRKGTHTTTATTLYSLPVGGEIIDSPGVWEFGLWQMPGADIERGFIDFNELRTSCKFANCLHSHEPSCAVKQAVANAHLPESRYNSYLQMLELFGN